MRVTPICRATRASPRATWRFAVTAATFLGPQAGARRGCARRTPAFAGSPQRAFAGGRSKAACSKPGQPLEIDSSRSTLGPREVLIRTAACGLCHSDLHFIEGAYPHPMPCMAGHEAAGIVEEVGSEVRT
jgi:hypothetical protein